jgi:glucose-6-phosphate dehydrogenase assembly protein OpcA
MKEGIMTNEAIATPTKVAVNDIEKTLKEMWRQAAEAQGPAVVRATVVNLLVYTTSDQSLETMTETVAALSNRHPSRAIVMRANPQAKQEGFDAWLSMHCRLLGREGKQVCGEQISMTADGPAVARLASAVLPLVLPNVPVVLFWYDQEDFASPQFRRLLRVANRVLFDTSRTTDTATTLTTISRLIGEHKNLTWGDLNWTRLTAWRELTAQWFDPPEQRPLLDAITAVTMHYQPGPEQFPPAEALLLLGWLASRLGWQPDQPLAPDNQGRYTGQLRCGPRQVAVTLAPGAAADPPGSLSELGLRAEGPGLQLGESHPSQIAFSLTRQADDSCGAIRIMIDEEVARQRMVALALQPGDELLAQELDVIGRDQTFEAAMHMAARLVVQP